MNFNTTQRGFKFYEFTDLYGEICSVQKSSLASEDAVWIGIADPIPKIMTSKGWKEYQMPKDSLISGRMHLNREQVKQLLPILTRFVETGEI